MRFQWSSSIPWDLNYSGYIKSNLYFTCRRSYALNCQMIPQNKVNIGAYMSRCEVHRLLRSLEPVIRKPLHSMIHITRFKSQGRWSRKDGLFVVLLWTSMSLRQLFTACGIATMRQVSSHGGLDEVVDAWHSTEWPISVLWRPSATARELQQDLRRVTVSDQTVRNRLREVSLGAIH